MASIGKILASAVSLNSEVQASLASFNFDFSLLKVEAPAEYAGVGTSLTKLRKHDAEDGTSHITARKLAALFANAIPPAPSLFKAYGHRATEISVSPITKNSTTTRHGAFADHAGTDGTTVWAAATSGREALAIHLLACLLARIWAADEAVALWIQLVQERKNHLQHEITVGSSFHSSNLFASKVELSRSQLAAWDANTRAWLSSADRVKKREQTQLRLVIDNITLPVNKAETLYESVMQTWITSMEMMESLLNGKSLSVQSGELLLGLFSWHIYPNLSVVLDKTTEIIQRDALVPEHVLVTVGLVSRAQVGGSGIHWSLPLAHLRYYGRPVVRTRHSGLSGSRVPFGDLLFVAIGSIFCTWQKNDADFTASIDLLCLISDNFLHIENPVAPWLAPIDEACRKYKSLDEVERTTAYQLIRLGYRFGGSFFGSQPNHPSAAFGLTDLRYLLRICSSAESRIKLLRYWARTNLKDSSQAVIRYFFPGSNVKRYALVELPERTRKRSRDCGIRSDHPEHWTHKQEQMRPIMHLKDGLQARLDNPERWQLEPNKQSRSEIQDDKGSTSSVPLQNWLNQEFLRNLSDLSSNELAQTQQTQNQIEKLQKEIEKLKDAVVQQSDNKTAMMYDEPSSAQAEGNFLYERDPDQIEDESETLWVPYPAYTHSDIDEKLQPYRFKAGVMDLAAILVPIRASSTAAPQNLLTCGQLEQFLKHKVKNGRSAFLSDILARHIWHTQVQMRYSAYFASLSALLWAHELYQHLPSAYVDLSVRKKPLHEAHFHQPQGKPPYKTDSGGEDQLRKTFSCIAWFETGSIDIPPADFKNAMAICHQDSIYVAHRLLQDPSDRDPTCLVTRIVGSIGKPGLSILHPPLAPEIRSVDAETSWHLANYKPFDGLFEDNFSATSLHLSFTGSSVAYDITVSGDIHRDVYFVETLIQAFDKGKWVADLDILGSRRLLRYGWPKSIKNDKQPIHSQLCTIDAWDELLGQSPHHAIFRARKNWMARLAAVTVLAQQSRLFSVISDYESMPGYSPRKEDAKKTPAANPRSDENAQEVSEPWLNYETQNAAADDFDSILGTKGGDFETFNPSDADAMSSRNSEIGVDVTMESNDDHPGSLSGSPSIASDTQCVDNSTNDEVVILIC